MVSNDLFPSEIFSMTFLQKRIPFLGDSGGERENLTIYRRTDIDVENPPFEDHVPMETMGCSMVFRIYVSLAKNDPIIFHRRISSTNEQFSITNC